MERAVSSGTVLCVNTGSSSLKLALVRWGSHGPTRLATATYENIGTPRAHAMASHAGRELTDSSPVPDLPVAFARLVRLLGDLGAPEPTAIGHRVVHGGPHCVQPRVVDSSLLEMLSRLAPLAPLHQDAALAVIAAAQLRWPGKLQVACFDTAFHARLPEVARRLPIPERLHRQGIRRYGFHGLSFESIVARLDPLPPRLVVAHLGSGSSVCAVRDGISIDTSMGLTPAGGVTMATRTGDLDPGVVLHLLSAEGASLRGVQNTLLRESGLLALGGTNDVRQLVERRGVDARAAFALDSFATSVKKAIGAMTIVLGGIDALVFTGGIGEHAFEVRALVAIGLEAIGVRIDETKNRANAASIAPEGALVDVRVMKSDEEATMARHVWDALGNDSTRAPEKRA